MTTKKPLEERVLQFLINKQKSSNKDTVSMYPKDADTFKESREDVVCFNICYYFDMSYNYPRRCVSE